MAVNAASEEVLELAETIKREGRRAPQYLPPLLARAQVLAEDKSRDPLTRALAHRAAGNAHHLMNRFDTALNSYNDAISLFERLDQQDELARTLHAKVGLLNFLCRFDELKECAARARSLFSAGGDSHRVARLDANLSHAYHRLDRFDLVLEHAERALPVLEQAGDAEGYLAALINSAVALTLMHDFAEADRRYRRALILTEKEGFAAWTLHCRFNIAYLMYLQGDAAAALHQNRAVRAAYEESGESRQLCACWLNDAEILLEVGDLEGVVHASGVAEALAAKLNLSMERGKALLFRAAACRRLQETAQTVLPLLDEASLCFHAERNSVWIALARLQLAVLRAENDDVATALAEATAARATLLDSHLPHQLAFANLVVGRLHRMTGSMDEAMAFFSAAGKTSSASGCDWLYFHAATELGACLAENQPESAREHFSRADVMLDTLWSRLGSDGLKLAFLSGRESLYTHLVRLSYPHSATDAFNMSEKAHSRVLGEKLAGEQSATDCSRRLGEDEVVLEYFVDGEDIYIFAVTCAAVQCAVQRGVSSKVKEHQRALERVLATCSARWERLGAVQESLESTANAHLEELYRLLVEPVSRLLRRRTVIVPHGFLHAMPFHALRNRDRFMAADHDVWYSPNARLYCTPAKEIEARTAVFAAFSNSADNTSIDEVVQAAALHPHAVTLINPTMPELAVVFREPHSLVHIAGHVKLDPIAGVLSGIDTVHGPLTSDDLRALSIRTKTLVITGCQTARRAVRPGDEWQGMMREFYLSGVSTIVAAMWNIRDEAARRFTAEFYRNGGANTPALAARTATLSLQNWRPHPYFWAGFATFVRKHTAMEAS